jgi:hypothetical protein
MNYQELIKLQKSHQIRAQQQSQQIVKSTLIHTLRPQKKDRETVIASTLRELVKQCGYERNGELLINVRDVLGIIEVLEIDESPRTHKNSLAQRTVPKASTQ